MVLNLARSVSAGSRTAERMAQKVHATAWAPGDAATAQFIDAERKRLASSRYAELEHTHLPCLSPAAMVLVLMTALPSSNTYCVADYLHLDHPIRTSAESDCVLHVCAIAQHGSIFSPHNQSTSVSGCSIV